MLHIPKLSVVVPSYSIFLFNIFTRLNANFQFFANTQVHGQLKISRPYISRIPQGATDRLRNGEGRVMLGVEDNRTASLQPIHWLSGLCSRLAVSIPFNLVLIVYSSPQKWKRRYLLKCMILVVRSPKLIIQHNYIYMSTLSGEEFDSVEFLVLA